MTVSLQPDVGLQPSSSWPSPAAPIARLLLEVRDRDDKHQVSRLAKNNAERELLHQHTSSPMKVAVPPVRRVRDESNNAVKLGGKRCAHPWVALSVVGCRFFCLVQRGGQKLNGH